MWLSFAFVFLILWWVVFFTVLPIGIQSENRPGRGHDHGAPKNPGLKKKIILTAAITLAMTVMFHSLLYVYEDELVRYFYPHNQTNQTGEGQWYP